MEQRLKLTAKVSKNQIGQRLDRALVRIFPDYSRSRIKEWIINQNVLVNGKICDKPNEKVLGGEAVSIVTKIQGEMRLEAQNIPLNIIYEDDDIIIINKPHNLVVHPGTGNLNNTLLNALLHYYPPIANVPRAGIVHRLDKDTTGLMMVAKNLPSQTRLAELLQLRKITRKYEALATGHIIASGTVDKPIGRHPMKRTHMSVRSMGKPAVTHYGIMEHFRMHTRLRLYLETGRTHQIRVHMAHITHPLVGDQVYGGALRLPKGASEEFITTLRKFDRQALHATMLCLYHPITGIKMEWHAPIPQDMKDLIEAMRADFEEHKDNVD